MCLLGAHCLDFRPAPWAKLLSPTKKGTNHVDSSLSEEYDVVSAFNRQVLFPPTKAARPSGKPVPLVSEGREGTRPCKRSSQFVAVQHILSILHP